MKITITKTTAPKTKPDSASLGFGKYFTDHMFIMNYTEGKGWHDPRIEPFHDLSLSPAAMVFHYGQEMFEGLKAYKDEQGNAYLFRPDMNAKRANNSNDRLCIPRIPEEDFVQAVEELVRVERDWIPTDEGTFPDIRPFIIATDHFLGVASLQDLSIHHHPFSQSAPYVRKRALRPGRDLRSRTNTSARVQAAAWASPRPAATTPLRLIAPAVKAQDDGLRAGALAGRRRAQIHRRGRRDERAASTSTGEIVTPIARRLTFSPA